MGRPALLASVFTDYICPFCYIGAVRLERLRERYDLKINWCFLEIHPDTPSGGMPVQRLGYSPALWTRMMDRLAAMAAEEGLALHAHDYTTNSHRALLLAEAAKGQGAEVFYRLHRRLFAAWFSEGLNIGDEALLRELACECGVAADLPDRAWTDARYEQQLQRFRRGAQELNVRATPTIFFGAGQRLDGALPYAAVLRAAQAGYAAQQDAEHRGAD